MNFTSIESILHPTDFSRASRVAFEHALKLALILKANLRIMHVAGDKDASWSDFADVNATVERWQLWRDPADVRETMEQWRFLAPSSPHHVSPQLGIVVETIIAKDSNPVRACLHELERRPAELIVLATHPYEGRMAWLRQTVAEPLARATAAMTLFIPNDAKGFVSSDDGTVQLRSVLIPVAEVPSPSAAIGAISRFTNLISPSNSGIVTTLHVSDGEAQPHAEPEATDWRWNQQYLGGSPVETILRIADEVKADLIAMTTKGRHGFLDLLRGTTTERVLHGAQCPVLAIPANPRL